VLKNVLEVLLILQLTMLLNVSNVMLLVFLVPQLLLHVPCVVRVITNLEQVVSRLVKMVNLEML
jgi:hypothetical protein